ncbi:hypothetical protein SAMN02910453_1142 [Lachnospiraceae bacterium A10]|nr:hypothetical protein SAMN02910453_1142 [Lachnospiraceae bacterium A10]
MKENLFCKSTGKTLIVLCVMAVNLFTGCGYTENAQVHSKVDLNSNTAKEENMLKFFINDEEIQVIWEENESVEALKNLVKDKPITIDMSMYGDFEQVGSIGQSIPRNDKQMTTSAGDIVLYSGNQLVVFYGSNSWAYTKLGHIDNTSAEEMKNRLGNGDVNVTISITE